MTTEMTLPNLVVIGAMKCGTTSLHRYLKSHPQVSMSGKKELDFFVAGSPNSRKGLAWYAAQFDASKPVRGESSPNYTKLLAHPGVPERLHSALPEAKLIYLLRDPIDRVVSHYVHVVASRLESRPLEEALEDLGENVLVDASLYARQLKAYLRYYPLDRIFVESSERLSAEVGATMEEIFAFLGVDPGFRSPVFEKHLHPSAKKRRPNRLGAAVVRVLGRQRGRRLKARPRLGPLLFDAIEPPFVSDALRKRLAERLAEDMAELRQLTGQSFSKWSI